MAGRKKKNYRELTDEELAKEVEEFRKALFNLRVRKVTDVVEKPSLFKEHRREIARALTEIRARELRKEKASATPASQS
ncbi:MAG: 50S ribosomal protein L29 [Planctomycetes bacterium]|nr:50S ribosomal protein L29 [Planctomycetota bacterium]